MTTLTTLVTARLAAAREAAIVERMACTGPSQVTAILAEGLPDGHDPFQRFAHAASVHVARIAPGCPCCIGNLTMRVTLNRLLRVQPHHLYLALSSASHLPQVIEWLTQPPYDALLQLNEVIDAGNEN